MSAIITWYGLGYILEQWEKTPIATAKPREVQFSYIDHIDKIQTKSKATTPTVRKSQTVQTDIQKQVQSIAKEYGYGTGEQWEALSWIIFKESSWNPNAQNPKSTAFGLFQFLDQTWIGYNCTKTLDITIQTKCGIKYINARYGTPTEAQKFHIRKGWY